MSGFVGRKITWLGLARAGFFTSQGFSSTRKLEGCYPLLEEVQILEQETRGVDVGRGPNHYNKSRCQSLYPYSLYFMSFILFA